MSANLSTPGHFTFLRFLRTLLLWAMLALFFRTVGVPHLRLTIPKSGYAQTEATYLGPQGLRKVPAGGNATRPPLIILLPWRAAGRASE